MIPVTQAMLDLLRRTWNYLTEAPVVLIFERRARNRSIIRMIGTILPLPSAPRVHFHLASWNPEVERFTDMSGCDLPTIQNQDNLNYQRQIDELHYELKAIKDKLAILLAKKSDASADRFSHTDSVVKNEKNCSETGVAIPPPPPPPPMPDLNLTPVQLPRLRKTKRNTPRYGSQTNSDALHLVISQLAKEKPKLRHVERSPGGRPIRPKRDPVDDPADILAQVLKKRYSVIQESSDGDSVTNLSFAELSSPIKTC